MDWSVKIGGEAGQGVQTIGTTLCTIFARAGLSVFTCQDYESRIRGGHNFYLIRLAEREITAPKDSVDILVALDKASIKEHEGELSERGMVVYDSFALKETYDSPNFMDVPFSSLAQEHGGNRIMANTVATGAVLGMLGMELSMLDRVLAETFRKKGEEVITGNRKAAQAGHDYALAHCRRCSFTLPPASAGKMLVSGNQALGLGAVAAGCKFYSAYPMTPSTGVMLYVASKAREYGIVVEQAEDEVAAINMAIGASFAGVRAMTGTSGGGFALMVEGLSLAAITETPVVVALVQRPGPATGLPTRTEQGDLLFAAYTSHGEFPRVMFAPGTPEQAFLLTQKAFDLSEKYQVPAIVLSDQYLADSQWTYNGLDPGAVPYVDYRLRGEAFSRLPSYNRHAYTEDGVTPMAVPGDAELLVVTDSDEHDQEGHLTEDPETRIKMVQKRLFQKLPNIQREISPPLLYGADAPNTVLVGWGSTYGVIKETVDMLNSKGQSAAMLHFSEILPFPLTDKFDYIALLLDARFTFCVEQNASSQFARLMRTETGYEFTGTINKYDGRQFTVQALKAAVDEKTGQ